MVAPNSDGTVCYTIDKFAMPTLHLVLGTGNKIVTDLQEKVPAVNEFFKKLCIVKESYQGKTFEGNELQNFLDHLEELRAYVPEEFVDYIEALEALRILKKSCFGFTLDPDWYKSIRNFELKWIVLKVKFKVSVINKCHIIFTHVEQQILRTGRALGEFSEQAVEACHQKFKVIWEWYKVKDVECEEHGKQFYKSVNHFNAFNI